MVCSEVVMFETVNDKMSVLFVDLIFIAVCEMVIQKKSLRELSVFALQVFTCLLIVLREKSVVFLWN